MNNSRIQNVARRVDRAHALFLLRVKQAKDAKPERRAGRDRQVIDASDRLRTEQAKLDACK